ncbi:arginase family protein [Paractinoplanes lichenicola]|uniref:Arginase family protein n=1 Tax=Paractinoplanes lichenicola TaxID=2802976 RepID=A0ABS1VQE3_9ACTN|nr:arginase family protein [Actinoplanes lichenicola]MBL7256834.1 arginase family protein [Actinoplanes lichenicola]
MSRRWTVLGVPSSAGAHTPGVEQGPAALREAGLINNLRAGGHDIEDRGDVRGFRWRPDPARQTGQNAATVAAVADDVATAVAAILADGRVPLVLGGDCSITVGVLAGFDRAAREPALLYMDGGPDLFTPETRPNGNLDAMGMAHLLRLPGHLPEVAAVGEPLTPARVVSFGDGLPDDGPDQERDLLQELSITRITAADVHRDTRAAAERALAAAGESFVLHFDVDVLRFTDMPIADVPDSGGDPIGLTLHEAMTCLSVFASGGDRLAALVITEVNPDHAPDRAVLDDFATAVATALST